MRRPAPELPCPDGVYALRLVLRRYVRDGASAASDEAWRAPARLMCDDARWRALQVEDLLIGLKRAWPTLADAERLPRTESPRLLARLVTICVKEFYGAPD